MTISGLIEKLEKIKEENGDIQVTIYSDQETNEKGNSEDEISTIIWEPKPNRLMLCDSFTFSELDQ